MEARKFNVKQIKKKPARDGVRDRKKSKNWTVVRIFIFPPPNSNSNKTRFGFFVSVGFHLWILSMEFSWHFSFFQEINFSSIALYFFHLISSHIFFSVIFRRNRPKTSLFCGAFLSFLSWMTTERERVRENEKINTIFQMFFRDFFHSSSCVTFLHLKKKVYIKTENRRQYEKYKTKVVRHLACSLNTQQHTTHNKVIKIILWLFPVWNFCKFLISYKLSFVYVWCVVESEELIKKGGKHVNCEHFISTHLEVD